MNHTFAIQNIWPSYVARSPITRVIQIRLQKGFRTCVVFCLTREFHHIVNLHVIIEVLTMAPMAPRGRCIALGDFQGTLMKIGLFKASARLQHRSPQLWEPQPPS